MSETSLCSLRLSVCLLGLVCSDWIPTPGTRSITAEPHSWSESFFYQHMCNLCEEMTHLDVISLFITKEGNKQSRYLKAYHLKHVSSLIFVFSFSDFGSFENAVGSVSLCWTSRSRSDTHSKICDSWVLFRSNSLCKGSSAADRTCEFLVEVIVCKIPERFGSCSAGLPSSPSAPPVL